MDDFKKKTLDLIEEVVPYISLPERGRQLLFVAMDYVVEGELVYARSVLAKIEERYFTDHLAGQTSTDVRLATTVASLIEVFGLDLALCRLLPGQA